MVKRVHKNSLVKETLTAISEQLKRLGQWTRKSDQQADTSLQSADDLLSVNVNELRYDSEQGYDSD